MRDRRLVDQPIESVEEESLGLAQYAQVLETFIVNCETPITIGIQGDWGIGKTSLLNMVRKLLGPRQGRKNRFHTIYFNTWQYSQFSQEEFLALSILKGIIAEMKSLGIFADESKKENLKQSLNKFSRFVTNLGNQVIQSKTGLDFQDAASASSLAEEDPLSNDITRLLRNLKDSFAELVASVVHNDGDKIVVLIDDLDRIRPVKALEFLEAIKNFLDVDHCVFLIAVDYSVVQIGMAEKLGKSAQELQGKSYFDKIIQVPFNMPITSYKLEQYIMSLLGWNFSPQDKSFSQQKREEFFLKIRESCISFETIKFFTNITSVTVGKNPRSIKRAVNYANLLKLIVQAKRKQNADGLRWKLEDAKLLYPLACMQLAWPELFNHFAEKPSPQTIHLFQDFEYISKVQGINDLFKRVHNPDEVKSNITGFFDEYISLIDKDEDGIVSFQEFKPILKIMVEANLTSADLLSLDDNWHRLQALVLNNVGSEINRDEVKAAINIFKSSNWNDPMKFKLRSAGQRFFNLVWNGVQIGSLVSTKKEPLQAYMKADIEYFIKHSSSSIQGYINDVRNKGHYGVGDVKVDICSISNDSNSVNIMNEILDIVIKYNSSFLGNTIKNFECADSLF